MIPSVPRGATIRSLLSVYNALGRTIRVGRVGALVLYMGFGAVRLWRVLLPQLSWQQLLKRHTLAPLLLAIQSKSERESLLACMLDPPKLVPRGYRQVEIAENIRRCPRCVEADLANGFAFSRVGHQLVPVRTCSEHQVPLQELCAACQAPFSSLQRFRQGPQIQEQIATCVNCGASEGQDLTVVPSPGYSAFCGLAADVLGGRAPVLAPQNRRAVIEHAAALIRAHSIDIDAEFAAYWCAGSIDQAAAYAGIRPEHIRAAFQAAKLSSSPYVIFATLGIAQHLLRRFGVSYGGEFSALPDFSHAPSNDAFSTSLIKAAHNWGISGRAAAGIAQGKTYRVKDGSHPSAVQRFIESLSQSETQILVLRQKERREALDLDKSPQRTAERVIARKALAKIARQANRARAADLKRAQARAGGSEGVGVGVGENDIGAGVGDNRAGVGVAGSPGRAQSRKAKARSPKQPKASGQSPRERRALAIDGVRESRRQEVLSFVKTHGAVATAKLSIRRLLKRDNPKLHYWCMTHDLEWLNKFCPAKVYQEVWHPFGAEPTVKQALAALDAGGFRSLTDLNRRRFTLYTWLRDNHPEALVERFAKPRPKQQNQPEPMPLPDGLLEKMRDNVLRYVERHRVEVSAGRTSVSVRKWISVKNDRLYGWCLKHDRAWFDEHAPYITKRSVPGR